MSGLGRGAGDQGLAECFGFVGDGFEKKSALFSARFAKGIECFSRHLTSGIDFRDGGFVKRGGEFFAVAWVDSEKSFARFRAGALCSDDLFSV